MTFSLYRCVGPIAVALTGWASPLPAQAQTLAEVRSLLRADRVADAHAVVDKRLAVDPHHVEALVGKVEALLQAGTDSKRLDAAIEIAERCVQQHPSAARCHNAMGDAVATKALTSGMLAAVRLAGRIRDAYQQAIALDARLADARFSLLQYYVQAPAVVGGGIDKARAFAGESARLLPQDGPLFQGVVAIADKQFGDAERLLMSVKAAPDTDAAERQNGLLRSLGFALLQDKKPAESQRVFALLQGRDPKDATTVFGLGRAAQEQGQCAQAIGHYERAIALKAAAYQHFRLAQCLQATGNPAAALASFERALAFKPPLNDKQRSEATERVSELKAASRG